METAKIEVRCDRCGKSEICDMDPATHKAICDKPIARLFVKIYRGTASRELTKDLCEGCTNEFERFMKGERLESGFVDPESLRPR